MNWVIIGPGNGLSPVRRQAITWTNACLLSIGLMGTYFSEIWIWILSSSFKKMQLKIVSAKITANFSSGRWVNPWIHGLMKGLVWQEKIDGWVWDTAANTHWSVFWGDETELVELVNPYSKTRSLHFVSSVEWLQKPETFSTWSTPVWKFPVLIIFFQTNRPSLPNGNVPWTKQTGRWIHRRGCYCNVVWSNFDIL